MSVTTRKLTVLYIEDDEALRLAVRDFLLLFGIEVLESGTGSHDLRTVVAIRPDVILVGHMQQSSALDVCRRLRADPLFAQAPIVMRAASRDRASAAAAGVTCVAQSSSFEPILRALEKTAHTGRLALVEAGRGHNLADIGSLFKKRSAQILPALKDQPRNAWPRLIAAALRDEDATRRGQAVIALALWHKNDDAPFNRVQGQRFFWGVVRHSLAAATAEQAASYWSRLAPVALALTYPPEHVARIVAQCCQHKSSDCRRWALRILAENRAPTAPELALQALSDDNQDVRATAARVLTGMGSEAHIAPLAHALSDSAASVLEQAALALAHIGGAHSTSALETALLNGTPESAQAAAQGLAALTTEEAAAALVRAAQNRYEPGVLRQVARALGTHPFQHPNSRQALLRLSQHPDSLVSETARAYSEG